MRGGPGSRIAGTATTTAKLGATGRREGIAAQAAVALLVPEPDQG